MATDAHKSDFITSSRQAARDLWNAYQQLLQYQAEWNAQDYTNTIEPDDFEGENAGLTVGNMSAVVFDTTNAIAADMAAGHATNVTNLL